MELGKILPLTAVLSALAMPAAAGWNLGAAYSNFSADEEALDVSLSGVTLAAGYEFKQADSKFSWMPEVRYGFGVADDTLSMGSVDVKIEADSFMAVSVRGAYHVSPSFNLFFQPAYGKLEVTASSGGASVSAESDWEFGYGAGIAFNATESASLELLYESFDDTDVISAGFRYHF